MTIVKNRYVAAQSSAILLSPPETTNTGGRLYAKLSAQQYYKLPGALLMVVMLASLLSAGSARAQNRKGRYDGFVQHEGGAIRLYEKQKKSPSFKKCTDDIVFVAAGNIVEPEATGNARLFIVGRRSQPLNKRTMVQLKPPPEQNGMTREVLDNIYDTESKAQNHIAENPTTKGGEPWVVEARTPRYGLALSSALTFRWKARAGVKQVVVTLTKAPDAGTLGEEKPWTKTITGTEAAYDGPTLTPGEYSWRVAQPEGEGDGYDEVHFTLASPAQAQNITRELADARRVDTGGGVNWAYLAVCMDNRQYAETEQSLQAALKTQPHSKTLYKWLMETYRVMHLWNDREAARAKLKALESTPKRGRQ